MTKFGTTLPKPARRNLRAETSAPKPPRRNSNEIASNPGRRIVDTTEFSGRSIRPRPYLKASKDFKDGAASIEEAIGILKAFYDSAGQRMYVRTYVRTYVRACVRAYVRTYVRTYVRMNVRTYVIAIPYRFRSGVDFEMGEIEVEMGG